MSKNPLNIFKNFEEESDEDMPQKLSSDEEKPGVQAKVTKNKTGYLKTKQKRESENISNTTSHKSQKIK
jgi:hypothetical protein